jgi:hypothetical protein
MSGTGFFIKIGLGYFITVSGRDDNKNEIISKFLKAFCSNLIIAKGSKNHKKVPFREIKG